MTSQRKRRGSISWELHLPSNPESSVTQCSLVSLPCSFNSQTALRVNQGTYPGPVRRSTKSHETSRTKLFRVGWCFFVSVRGSGACVRLLSTLAGMLFQQSAKARRDASAPILTLRARGAFLCHRAPLLSKKTDGTAALATDFRSSVCDNGRLEDKFTLSLVLPAHHASGGLFCIDPLINE